MISPKITVAIVVDAKSNFYHWALTSILEQSFAFLELIILSDTEFPFPKKNHNGNIVVSIDSMFHRKSAAYNYALSIARGKYICFIDEDKFSDPDRFKIQFEYMESHPKCGMVACGMELLDEYGDHLKFVNDFIANTSQIRTLLLISNFMINSTILFRLSSIKKFRITFDTSLRNSYKYAFISQCADCFSGFQLPKPLVKKRLRSNLFEFKQEVKREYFYKIQLKLLARILQKITSTEIKLHYKLVGKYRLSIDELSLAVSWLNRILLANNINKIYNQNRLFQVFETLLLSAVSINHRDIWSIDKLLLNFIEDKLDFGKTILEFGSGGGTYDLLSNYKVISLEENLEFSFARSEQHSCFFAPIVETWYESNLVKHVLSLKFDLLLIDGPVGNNRNGFLAHLDLFQNMKKPVVFDDMQREPDLKAMKRFCKVLGFNYKILSSENKKFAYCIPNSSLS